jgi:cystathionine gamma-lyase
MPREMREKGGIYDDLIRLSVGVEDTEDLVQDVLNALEVSVKEH